MAVLQDLRVMELMASRMCHDLISPVGAINNGIELLEEMGAQVGEEAVKLIGHSAEQASRRLRLFRLCYGAAGADANLTCDDVLATARDYLTGGRVVLVWDSVLLRGAEVPRGTAKVLLNVVVLAVETLVHGGTITVTHNAEGGLVTVQADGRGAGQRTEAWPALRGELGVDELNARNIHPHVTGRFAEAYQVALATRQESEDQLVVELSCRGGA